MHKPLMAAALLLALALPAQAKIVCWTDNNGQRACGDRVPPEFAKKERQVYDAQGRLTETKAREKTEAELAEAAREAAAREAAEKAAAEQARYDSYLMQTYTSVGEIEGARDARLRIVDARIELAQKSVADTERVLSDLKKRAGDKPNPKQAKQIADYEKALVDNLTALASLRSERDKIQTKFTADIARYRELTGSAVPAEEPPPEPEA